MGDNKELIRFSDLYLIFKVTAVEKLKIHGGGHLFSLKTLFLYFLNSCVNFINSLTDFMVVFVLCKACSFNDLSGQVNILSEIFIIMSEFTVNV